MDKKLTVYLAGGMRKVWREQVKAAVPEVGYLDPTLTGLTNEEEYTNWDLGAVSTSDIVFGYLENDNPSGYGLMIELGVAWARGKATIFVDEKPSMRKYTGMPRVMADRVAETLQDGIELLKALVRDWHTEDGSAEEVF